MNAVYKIEKWTALQPPNPAMLRHILVSEGYDVFQWQDPPDTVYGNHRHDNDQSHWILSGSLELTIEHVGIFMLDTGDRDFMPAGTYHSARVAGEEPVMYLTGEKMR